MNRSIPANPEPDNRPSMQSTIEQLQTELAAMQDAAVAMDASYHLFKNFFNDSPLIMRIVETSTSDIWYILENSSAQKVRDEPHRFDAQRSLSDQGTDSATIELWLNHYDRAASSGQPVTFEHTTAFGNDVRWLAATVHHVCLMSSGRQRFSYTAVDITQQKATEAMLRQSHEESLAASRAKSQFLATMSHEIRTPIAGVLGMTQLLISSGLTSEQRAYADAISGSSNALITIVNDVLDVAKIEAGKLDFTDAPFSPAAAAQAAGVAVKPLLLAKNLTLQVDIHQDIPDSVVGDAGRYGQILINLLSNAIKCTEVGTISLQIKTLTADTGSAVLKTSVVDPGIGIDKAANPQLFSPFVQGEGSASRSGGTGLGLSITKNLVERMGGSVGYDSEVGKGSTFFFTAKFALAAPTERPDQEAKTLPTFTGRVLLAEDNPTNQEVARLNLERFGLQVDVAGNGADALRMLEAFPVDLVFMDCQMPVMDGYDTARAIRQLKRPYANVPIIAITANAMKGARELCLDAGMNDYLSKPYSRHELAMLLAQWLPDQVTGEPNDTASIKAEIKGRFASSQHILREACTIFIADYPALAARIQAASAAKDVKALVSAVHSLKGAAGNFTNTLVVPVAEAIETAARKGDLATASVNLLRLDDEAKRLCSYLSAL